MFEALELFWKYSFYFFRAERDHLTTKFQLSRRPSGFRETNTDVINFGFWLRIPPTSSSL